MQQSKVVVIGTVGCGKSSIVEKLARNTFSINYTPTIGVDVIPVKYGDKVINFWDIAGMKKLAILRDGYYSCTQGILAVYDLSGNVNKQIKYLKGEIEKIRAKEGNIPCVLVGTKADLLTIENKALYKCSSMFGDGIEDLRERLYSM